MYYIIHESTDLFSNVTSLNIYEKLRIVNEIKTGYCFVYAKPYIITHRKLRGILRICKISDHSPVSTTQ